jgi:hypothetical protein
MRRLPSLFSDQMNDTSMQANETPAAVEPRPLVFAGLPATSWAFAIRASLAVIPALYVSFWLELEAPSSLQPETIPHSDVPAIPAPEKLEPGLTRRGRASVQPLTCPATAPFSGTGSRHAIAKVIQMPFG